MPSLEHNCETLAIALLAEQAGLAALAAVSGIVHADKSTNTQVDSVDRIVCEAAQHEVGVAGIKPWAPLAWCVPLTVTIRLSANDTAKLDAYQAAVKAAFEGTASAPIIALATSLPLPGLNIRDTDEGEHEQANDERTRAKRWDFYVNVETPASYDADAQDFFTRVTANSGTLSDATKTAVNTFVLAAKANGYWTKLTRINLFCGDQLAAALVPLKVGGGGATDTNNNFVAGDYSLATGLTGNGTTKSLGTGLLANALSANDTHLAVYNRSSTAVGGGVAIGAGSVSFYGPYSDSKIYSDQYDTVNGRALGVVAAPFGLLVGSRTSATAHEIYRNAVSIATNATSGGSLPATAFTVMSSISHAMGMYSIGAGLTDANVTSYYADIQAAMTAFGRAVAP